MGRQRDGGRADASRRRTQAEAETARQQPPQTTAGDARIRQASDDGQAERVRDADRRIREQAERLRVLEREHPDWAHTFREHVDATDQELARRARTGVNARGQHRDAPPHATRWTSDTACVRAAAAVLRSPEAQEQRRQALAGGGLEFGGRVPLRTALGPGWRDDVYGRSRASGGAEASRWPPDSRVFALWRKQPDGQWHLYTCYPQVYPP